MNDVIIYLITIVHFFLSTTTINPIRDVATPATMVLKEQQVTTCSFSIRT